MKISTKSGWKLSQIAMKTTGTVKFFDEVKGVLDFLSFFTLIYNFSIYLGFGFIDVNDGGESIFVHQSNIKKNGFRSLRDGEEVEFDVATDEKKNKPYAINVTGPNGSDVLGSERGSGGGERGNRSASKPRRKTFD
jgi:cold shock CspA family protein